MKTHFTTLLLLTAAISFGQNNSRYENTYEVTFEDNYSEVVTIKDNPEDIVKNYIDWSLLRFGIYFGHDEAAVWGPFIASVSYARLLKGNDQFITTDFNFPIVDVAKMNYYRGERRLSRLYMEGFYNYGFTDWETEKEKKLNFYNPDRQTGEPNTYTIHRAELPFITERQLAARAGLLFMQRSIYNQNLDQLLPDNQNEQDGLISNIYGTRSVIIGIGITLNKIINLEYESEGFGNQKSHYFGNTYLDLLIAPLTSNFYSRSLYNPDCSCFDEIEYGAADESLDLDVNPIGFRIGFNKKASLVRSTKFGQTLGVEGGVLPGLSSGSGYVMINYGLSWGF